jgi:hypothetical protein
LPSSFDKAFAIAQGVKALLSSKGRATRSARPDSWRGSSEQRKKIKEEISRLKYGLHTAENQAERAEYRKNLKSKKQEFFQLKNEFRTAEEQRAKDTADGWSASRIADDGEAGALPDFVIIGGQKCGTTSLYHLLTHHPHVEPAAFKELHYFNNLFDKGIEWYRRCFPQPRWKDGRKTITGEATPAYLFRPHVPEMMAQIIPQARLIALLRNPVDRAYSQYHQRVKKGRETRSFEEAVAAEEARLRSERYETLEDEHHGDNHENSSYLSRGIYVDQLLRWSRFFSDEQMLVLKSEDFFERPQDALKLVLGFLGLPDWKPEAWETRKKGRYERGMDPATRGRLEEFFEPHNRRLYEYLGVDFGW